MCEMGRRLLAVGCLVVLFLGVSDAVEETTETPECSAVETEEMMDCLNHFDNLADDADPCEALQTTINCTVDETKGCDNQIAHYVAPRIYSWAMTGSALQCDDLIVGEDIVTFEDPKQCQFYEVYNCYQEIFDRMGIVMETSTSTVEVADLMNWLHAPESLLDAEKRATYCDYLKAPLNYSSMAECGTNLKVMCSQGLPLVNEIPDKPTANLPADPYDSLLPLEQLVLAICTEACEDLNDLQAEVEACLGDDFTNIVSGIDGEDSAGCEELENITICMKTNINNCTYLVAHYEKWLEETAEEALEICKISPELGPPPPTVLPQMTTTDLASRLTTGLSGIVAAAVISFLLC